MLTSKQINDANKNLVSSMIAMKQSSNPYYSSGPSAVTDMDVFPYPRFYRGGTGERPVVMEREAGWNSIKNKCYTQSSLQSNEVQMYPNHCFQAAPSVTYPCYPELLRKYSDKDALNLQLLRKSINEYR